MLDSAPASVLDFRSIFDRLIDWLRDLQAKVNAQAQQITGLSSAVGQLQQEVVALQEATDDDSGLAARVAAVEASIADLTAAIEALIPGPATHLVITINQGEPMPGVAISIDDTAGKASYEWLDDHGDVTTDVPVSADGGAVTVSLSSDNPAVATLATDPNDATGKTFDITPVAVGDFNVVASAVDDQGAAANFADGQPITGSTAASVVPGPAASLAVQAQA